MPPSGSKTSFLGCAGTFALVAVAVSLAGCGGSATQTGSTPVNPTGPVTPAITLAATPTGSITTAQSLSVVVSVSVSSGTATPAGTVVLSSGNYASFPAALSGGQATLVVPAGQLAAGTDVLAATFTPSQATAYNAASGMASVVVAAASNPAPTVTSTSVTYPTVGAPFRALPTASGDVLVSVTGASAGVQVFKPADSGGGLQASCVNPLPAGVASILGINLFAKGAGVAAAVNNYGALFLNEASLEMCTATGTLVSQGTLASGQGVFDITVTSDGKYAFVANEYGVAAGSVNDGNIGVVALQYDASGNILPSSTLLGQISTGGNAIAGVLLSPDGTRLYVTSEVAGANTTASGSSNPVLAKTGCKETATAAASRNGLLTVIDVAKAEADPGSSAILANINGGCFPVRMVETADRSTLWVSARGDGRVLAFSTGMLEFNPDNALLGYANTGGTDPIGLQLFHNQTLLAVANSNRFGSGTGSAPQNLSIVSVANPTAPARVATFASGLFPREIQVGADDATLYLTNYNSDTLQVVTTTVQ